MMPLCRVHLILVCLCALLLLPACSGGDKEQMLHQLEELERMNRAYELMTNDTLAQQLVEFFDRHGTANERMRAYYMLGSVYRDIGEVPKALESFLHAIEKADTTNADCNYKVLLAIYGQMADIYHAQYLPEDELNALLQSEHFAWRANDTIAAIKAYELRARPFFSKMIPMLS